VYTVPCISCIISFDFNIETVHVVSDATIILPVFVYGSETLSLTLREERSEGVVCGSETWSLTLREERSEGVVYGCDTWFSRIE
jgi:hypothetical protein